MTDLLFVYGTLRRQIGADLLRRLAPRAEYVDTARTRGVMIDLGSYPGLIPRDGGEHWVQGDLVRLSPRDCVASVKRDALASIDAYEGCAPGDPRPREFERVRIRVVRGSGKSAEAWAYRHAGSSRGHDRIPSGDYLAWTRLGPKP